MSARHPLKLSEGVSDYVNPAECSLIRIFHTGFRDDSAWAVDAAKLDEDGNVVGYTEESWERPTWDEIVGVLHEFVAEVVPHLLVDTSKSSVLY